MDGRSATDTFVTPAAHGTATSVPFAAAAPSTVAALAHAGMRMCAVVVWPAGTVTTTVAPSPTHGAPRYAPVVWGYFGAQRFAGDFADFGKEIQISDFAAADSWHVANQARFVDEVDFEKPFSLEENRRLLSRED